MNPTAGEWQDRYIHVDEQPRSPRDEAEADVQESSFSLDDLMSAVKVAATVPDELQDGVCPTAQLVSWGVPVKKSPRNSAASDNGGNSESNNNGENDDTTRRPSVKELKDVERRLSVKLDLLIEKVDQLQSCETAMAIQDGDERRNRSSSEASLLPDARKRTSTESTEKESRRTSSDSTESRCEKEQRRTSSEVSEPEHRVSVTENPEKESYAVHTSRASGGGGGAAEEAAGKRQQR